MRATRGWHRLVEALPRLPVRPGAPFLGTWRLSGPFAPGEDPGPERVLALGPDAWRDFDERTINRAYDDFNDLHLWLRRELGHAAPDSSVVYAHVWIHASVRAGAELRLGASGPIQAWWDAQQVLAAEGWTLRRDRRRAALRLAAGWHRLVLRAEHAGGPWGFYARLTDHRAERVDGLTVTLGGPGALSVGTWALPRGYVGWPYVELDNRRGEPRASPFELVAAGGHPSYRWSLVGRALPAGLELCAETGAITGVPAERNRHAVVVRVEDGAGERAERCLELRIEDPPTRWYEESRLGVFVHFDKPDAVAVKTWDEGIAAHPGYAENWASLAHQAGASVLILTAKHHDSWANWPTDVRRSDGVPAQRSGTDSLAAGKLAATARGMRFGIYFSTLDTWHPGYRNDVSDYLRFQFRQLEELVERYQPSLVWLDGHWDAPRRDWGYDPLFSLVHGRVPEAVIANNPGRRTLNVGDTGYGDVDVRTFEGHSYWDHMPRRQAPRRNPRPLPGQKLSFTCNWWSPGADPRWLGCERNRCWQEWIRVLSQVVGDGGMLLLGIGPGFPGAPPGSPAPGELYSGASDVLTGIGEWLYPERAEAFVGVRPGPLAPARWGRCLQRPGRLYLHLPPGAADGWPDARLRVGPLPGDLNVTTAHVLPGRSPVPFAQSAGVLTLEFADVVADSVLSLVALDTGDPQTSAPAPAYTSSRRST